MRRQQLILAAAIAAAAAAPAWAQNLKPGLWEITSKSSSPQMDQAMAEMQKQMASMPPAQRKQMEEMMARQGVKMSPGAGGAMTIQMCMTEEMTRRDTPPMDARGDCKITQQRKTGNTTHMAYTCANPPSSGEGSFTYNGPESYSNKMMVKTTVQGKPETVTMEGTGKWLKADCGSVKPFTPPKQ